MTNRDYSYNGWWTPMQREKTYDKQGLISTPLVPMSTPVQVQENVKGRYQVTLVFSAWLPSPCGYVSFMLRIV